MNIIDTIPAYSIQAPNEDNDFQGDQILIDGDPIEVKRVLDTEDEDEVVVIGYSHDTGDTIRYELFADDYFDVWAV